MNYIIFDLEATCGWPNEHRQSEIIEIGAVKVTHVNNELKVVDEFQTFVKPILNPELTDFCKRLTHIQQEDVDNAPLFPKAFAEFRTWIGFDKQFVLCSWGHYDKKQLKQDIKLHTGLDSDWLDNCHISIKHQHGQMIGVPKGVGMQKALEMLGIPLEGTHHRGIDDARNIAKIFIRIFDNLKFPAAIRR